MKTYWFIDEDGIVRPVYEDEDGLYSPNFQYDLEIHGNVLWCCMASPLTGQMLVDAEYALYNSLAELAKVIEG